MLNHEKRSEATFGRLTVAKAASVTAAGVTLILPGQNVPTQKAYRRLKGSDIKGGDMVVVSKIAGTYVVLDSLGTTSSIVTDAEFSDRISELMEEAALAVSEAEDALTAAEEALSIVSSIRAEYYDYENSDRIIVPDGESRTVIIFKKYSTTVDTHIDFHGEITMLIDTSESYDPDTDTYTEADGEVRITYLLDGEPILSFHPGEDFFDGKHILHLVYTWWASGKIDSRFEVQMSCKDCTATIETAESRGYIAGLGLIGDNAWDGSIRINEDFIPLDFSRTQKSFDEDLPGYSPAADSGHVYENVARANFSSILKGFSGIVHGARLHRFSVINQDEMTCINVVISGNSWVVDNAGMHGTVTTPNCEASQILRVTSTHSDDDVAYIVSFNGGTNWWTFANGWVEPDYTKDVYGMFEGTMRSITSEQWAEKLNGSVMIRAILTGDSALTDIQIYSEVYQ